MSIALLPTTHDPRHLATLAIYKISYRLRNAACHRFFARTPVAFPSLISLREAARIPRFFSLLRTCSLIQFTSCETTTTWQAASKIESKASGKASHHARRFTNISIFCNSKLWLLFDTVQLPTIPIRLGRQHGTFN